MSADLSAFSEPIASTSRAVFTLPYKESDPDELEEEQTDAFADPIRLELYSRAWSECNDRIQTTLSTLHDASLDHIVAFTHSSRSTEVKDSLYTTLSGRVPLRTGLIIGASPGSSSLLYSSLTRLLSAAPPPLSPPNPSSSPAHPPCIVSRLSSRDCSNIKNALRSLIGGFVGSRANVEVVDEEDEEEDELDVGGGGGGGSRTLKSQLLVPEDMHNLTAWYESKFGKNDSDSAPTLTILLEDLEAMDGKVLTQLLETLALYTPSLPLVLLIGIATTPDALYSLVPRKTANKLDAQSFFVDPGVGAFNALIRGLFLSSPPPPLLLSPKSYNDLSRTFTDLHHSIDATISFIQYLYMRHFVTSPVASLTLPLRSREEEEHGEKRELTQEEATAFFSLPSMTAPADPSSSTSLPPLVVDGDGVRTPSTLLPASRAALIEWYAARALAFEALMGMMEFWEKRRAVEGVLGMVLGESEGAAGQGMGKGLEKVVGELCGLVLQASSSKLPLFLKHLISRLTSFLSTSTSTSPTPTPNPYLPPPLLPFLETQLSLLTPILSAPRPPGRTNLINTNLAGSLSLSGAGLGGPGGLTDADRQFSRLAKETSEGLRGRLREGFEPVERRVRGWEVCVAEDSSAMKRFHPTPLPSLLSQLKKLDPLSSQQLSSSADPTPAPAPLDLAVAYRTYVETHPSGRLANLGEWYGGWELGIADEEEEEGENGENGRGGGGKANGKGKKRAREDEEEGEDGEEEDEEEEEEDEEDEGPLRRKQARFLRCVGDLAHLGFLHPTTYKPEHVVKSVY